MMWKSLSTEQKHEVEALAAGWQGFHVRQIELGMPASSPELSDYDPTMEDAFDDKLEPLPTPIHVGLTVE